LIDWRVQLHPLFQNTYMKKVIKIALKELGVSEKPGELHNSRILQYAEEGGFNWVKDDETPWCSIFAAWVAKKGRLEYSKNAMARTWLNVGIATNEPREGDVVVLWRKSKEGPFGHVGFFVCFSKDRKRIVLIGGNQKNQVSFTSYPVARVLGYRRLRLEVDTPEYWT